MNAPPVIDNRSASRYEMRIDEQLAFINYRRQIVDGNNVVNMVHAEVPHTLRGQGYGAQLAQGALDLARSANERVIPGCPFVAAFIRRNPEYLSLLPTS